MSGEKKTPFWARCGDASCGHCWTVAYLPMDVRTFAKLAKAGCPMCGGKAFVAKQANGILQEPDQPQSTEGGHHG